MIDMKELAEKMNKLYGCHLTHVTKYRGVPYSLVLNLAFWVETKEITRSLKRRAFGANAHKDKPVMYPVTETLFHDTLKKCLKQLIHDKVLDNYYLSITDKDIHNLYEVRVTYLQRSSKAYAM